VATALRQVPAAREQLVRLAVADIEVLRRLFLHEHVHVGDVHPYVGGAARAPELVQQKLYDLGL